ncbi:fungal-specific transcription factor domain-containing protein [Mariannaea sp. PMI_226]|nr:fungal-specific transcription factor domain-containing protein [Mariannaea sp. PMI_226]
MPAKNRNRPIASQRYRTKTFTGCWTCRAKHVKCDEHRPTCSRCRNSKIECEGYGVRLLWNSARAPTARRELIDGYNISISGPPPKPAFAKPTNGNTQLPQDPVGWSGEGCNQGLETALVAIDTATLQSNPQTSPQPSQREWCSSTLVPTSTTPSCSIATDHTSHSQPLLDTLAQDQNMVLSHQDSPAAGSSRSARRSPAAMPESESTPPQTASPSGIYHIPQSISDDQTSASEFLAVEYDPKTVRALVEEPSNVSNDVSRSCSRPSEPRHNERHLDTLPESSVQRTILNYWTVHLCDTVLPVPNLQNPLREIFMPIALEGARSPSGSSTAATAVFHLICTASAFQLSRIREDAAERRQFARLALSHHNLGLLHLRRNLLTSQREQYVAVLAALTMCVIVETITVSNPSWSDHFLGALNWIRNIEPEFWSRSNSASVVYQMFVGLAILSMSPFILDGECRSNISYIDFHCPPELYCLDRIYGIPYETLKVINTLNNTQNLGSARDLDLMEMEMYLAAPKISIQGDANQESKLLYHLNYAFYYAALIYFARTIRKTPVADVQPLVEKSLEHLETTISCTAKSFSPLVWTAAITAFEMADTFLRKRFLTLLELFWKKTDFDVWEKVNVLTTRLWVERDSIDGEKNLQWQEFLRMEPELRLMMV